MKVKVISRSTDEFTRERSQDLQVTLISTNSTQNLFFFFFPSPLSHWKFYFFTQFDQRVFRNFDPNIRTQEKAVEYVRALNAAKLEKVIFSFGLYNFGLYEIFGDLGLYSFFFYPFFWFMVV